MKRLLERRWAPPLLYHLLPWVSCLVGFWGMVAAADRTGVWFWLLMMLCPVVIMYGLIVIEIRFKISERACSSYR